MRPENSRTVAESRWNSMEQLVRLVGSSPAVDAPKPEVKKTDYRQTTMMKKRLNMVDGTDGRQLPGWKSSSCGKGENMRWEVAQMEQVRSRSHACGAEKTLTALFAEYRVPAGLAGRGDPQGLGG